MHNNGNARSPGAFSEIIPCALPNKKKHEPKSFGNSPLRLSDEKCFEFLHKKFLLHQTVESEGQKAAQPHLGVTAQMFVCHCSVWHRAPAFSPARLNLELPTGLLTQINYKICSEIQTDFKVGHWLFVYPSSTPVLLVVIEKNLQKGKKHKIFNTFSVFCLFQ